MSTFKFTLQSMCSIKYPICRRREADAVYTLGIARRVAPLDHIKSRYAEFQKRMMSTTSTPISPPPVTTRVSTPAARPVLATTSLGTEVVSPSSRGVTHARAPSASNAPIQVFVDPSGSESDFGVNAWADLGTRKTRIKENVPETKKLVGTTLKQAGKTKRLASAASAASGSRIIPYRDGDGDDMPPPSGLPPKKVKSGASKALSKGAFVPFVDDNDEVKAESEPNTSNFVPFRDEVSAEVAPLHTC